MIKTIQLKECNIECVIMQCFSERDELTLVIGMCTIGSGRTIDDGSLHVVYSKMLSEVRASQPEPRSGVAYVYSISATEQPLLEEYAPLPSEFSVSQEIKTMQKAPSFLKNIPVGPKVLSYKQNKVHSSRQAKSGHLDNLVLGSNGSLGLLKASLLHKK